MVIVQECNISFFKKKTKYNNSKSTFYSMFTIVTTMGTPSMIAFKMKVVNANIKYEYKQIIRKVEIL